MKKVLLAATALVASVGIAMAADLPQHQIAPAPYAAPAFTWTGFYVGAHGGYAWGESTGHNAFFLDNIKADTDGGFGGLQAGYNQQLGNVVLGLEIDASYGDISGNFGVPPGGTISGSIDWMGTIRARAGYAFGNILPYVTGGVAWANNQIKVSSIGFNLSQDKLHTGWVLGAGVEYAFTNHISAKVEYLYADLGREGYLDNLVPGGVNFDGHVQTVKAGVNYRF